MPKVQCPGACVGRLKRWNAKDELQHPITLRFNSALSENAYGQACKNRIAHNGACLALMLTIATLCIIASSQLFPAKSDIRVGRYSAGLLCGIAGFSLILALTAKLQRLVTWLLPLAIEVAAVIGTAIIVAAACSADRYYMAKIAGVTAPGQAFDGASPYMTDTNILLVLTISTTVTHVFLPIRWLALLPLDVFIVSLYAIFEFGLGGPEQSFAHFYLMQLTIAVFSTLLGKRSFENHDRDAFARLLAEKTHRVQLEFQLDQAYGAPAVATSSGNVDASSTASTTNTHGMFQELSRAIHEGGGIAEQLDHITKLGKQEHWLIMKQDLHIFPSVLLGAGTYGVVVGGSLRGLQVAVKMPHSKDSNTPLTSLAELANELCILRLLRHPNICSLYGACLDMELGHMSLVLELVDGETLHSFIPKTAILQNGTMGQLMIGICSALHYLHVNDPCIIHGDLKPSNIMVEQPSSIQPKPKLLDFGLARRKTTHAAKLLGTTSYMAPEIVISLHKKTHLQPKPAADTFSLGCVLYFIITGNGPFAGLSKREIVKLAYTGKPCDLRWPDKFEFTSIFGQLLGKCLCGNAHDRPRTRDIHGEVLKWYFDRVAAQDMPSQVHFEWHAAVNRAINSGGHPSTDHMNRSRTQQEQFHMLFPKFTPTPISTQLLCLVQCVQQWNLVLKDAQCCDYHGQVEAVQRIINELKHRDCKETLFVPLDQVQCQKCFAMGGCAHESFQCKVCDSSEFNEAEGILDNPWSVDKSVVPAPMGMSGALSEAPQRDGRDFNGTL